MWGQKSFINASTDWERETAKKLEIMSKCIFKIRNSIVGFTKAREDSGLDFTFGSTKIENTRQWVREGPHHSLVVKNVLGRILSGMGFLSDMYGNKTEGKRLKH